MTSRNKHSRDDFRDDRSVFIVTAKKCRVYSAVLLQLVQRYILTDTQRCHGCFSDLFELNKAQRIILVYQFVNYYCELLLLTVNCDRMQIFTIGES